ncbi:porphobilinogen deaminase isoform X3 [Cephus cinctus]|nr:porphobilinogen deaminase isoform X3 [Cephus cinctus]XP_024947827.1 porphobilinogen deaminase isoform X3 [Cephus cinctus]XP_024947828.1 porphobilinogen deaminase isoform X3 [Cephus cinctus]XP_024947829.1 porphobilinogen deaminase isoform X3 [Cephus cinctus]XP_024947830.1 porphobilinogen deaminase isoform X3 [Cephus cinctus]
MNTKGDKILDKSLPKIGEKSLFTEELELALESGRVDFVVHSLKDLPTTLPEGMALGAILKREDPRDAVVMSKKYQGKTLETLPEGSIIGTSSLRRSAQLARNMPHLKVENIRGNLNTRLKKLDDEDGPFAAIILAAAGLNRMGWQDRISQLLDPEDTLYAIGQGALGVECRETDWNTLSLLEPLHDVETTLKCVCERSFLKTLGGGCSAPVAVASSLNGKDLTITGAVWSLDGQTLIKDTLKSKLYLPNDDGEPPKKCPYREPRLYCSVAPGKVSGISLLGAEQLGKDIAKSLIDKDALEIMSKARNEILSTA